MIAMNSEVSTPARLADYARVSTADVDDAAEAIGRIFCPHDLKPVDHSAPDFRAEHNCADFDGFSVTYVAYGGARPRPPRLPCPRQHAPMGASPCSARCSTASPKV